VTVTEIQNHDFNGDALALVRDGADPYDTDFDIAVVAFIDVLLGKGWSPEQIGDALAPVYAALPVIV
jgi:hypothetical protein